MTYLYTKREHYIQFTEKYKTDRLIKDLKIATQSKGGFIIKEIFNSPIYTDYKIEYNLNDRLLISFLSKSTMKYRLDIFTINEVDKCGIINHIAFSDYNSSIEDDIEYEGELNKNEMIEVMNRIHFILKDILNKGIINNYFCIGGSDSLKKNNIYKYSLKIIVGEGGFDKLPTQIYKSGFGLYFKI